MNEKLNEKPDPARLEMKPTASGKFKLARWQTLADFGSRSAHQQVHRPAVRISYAFLRNATFGFAIFYQAGLPSAPGNTITGHVHAEGKSGADTVGQLEKRVSFDKTGKVDVYCSIHHRLYCRMSLPDNSYFTMTDAGGCDSLPNVPSGIYELKAGHDLPPPDESEINLPANGVVKADVTLVINNPPQLRK